MTKINLLNDAAFKAIFRSIEARDVVSNVLSELTSIPVEDIKNAEFQGGEFPKRNLKEKNKVSDVLIKVDDNRRIIVECNRKYSESMFF